MRRSIGQLGKHAKGRASHTWFAPQQHRYKELFRWQREAMGLNKFEYSLSHRPLPRFRRFNPSASHITKGTTAYAWRWKMEHQAHLPTLPPNGYIAPSPLGKVAWPSSWSDDFANEILQLDDAQLRSKIFAELSDAIFKETQRDGYEMRRFDFENRPLTEVPEPEVIEAFVLEEDTIRDRIIAAVVEGKFGFTPTSEHREELRSVDQIIDYIVERVRTCREVQFDDVSDHVKKVLSEFPVQPELGFAHALPGSKWGDVKLLEEWEKLFHHQWQFGRAVFTPRSEENTQGNLTWLRMDEEWRQREEFQKRVASGELQAEHRRLIEEAARS